MGTTTFLPTLAATRVSLSRVAVPFLAVLYLTALILTFRYFVTRYWGYNGLVWNPPSTLIEWALMIIPAMIPAFVLSVTYDRPSRLVLWLLYIVVYVPSCVVSPLVEGRVGNYWYFILALLASFLILIFMTEMPLAKIPPLAIPISWFYVGIGVFTAFTLALSFWFYGLPTSIPGLSEVYEVRTLQRSRTENAPLLLAYLAGWQYKVINPLFMALGLQLRNKWLVIGGLVGQLYFYSVSGHKSILFSGVLVFGIWLLTRKFRVVIGPMALIGTIGMIVVTSVILLAGNLMLFSILVRRLLVVPGQLSGWYFDFFTQFGFTRQTDPVTRMLFEYPYELTPPYLVGLYYSGSSSLSANANFWASAYAGFGFGGMLAVTLIFGAMLWVMNSMAVGEYRLIGNILVGLSAFSLTNSELFTTIGTHGLGIALVLLIVQPILSSSNEPGVDDPTERDVPHERRAE